ncbi:hypothetical protein Ndes2526B_g05588 [Nannochloris sp. 'desiccata']|nr:hypothetical protein KSW81_007444 [Chlorella desiccata (nom. nud.)]KAH7618673.1 putative Flowering time control protein FY [Chlorella desiccata (nom. nud.)]
MALYTSYYARQLALRPETITGGDQQVEGEKAVQKSVARRMVDFTGPYLSWIENRRLIHSPADMPGLFGIPAAALDLLPPVACAHQPASSFAVKFAGQAPSKTRSSVNVASWTPDGRRCLTGTQAGEFCLWDGQTFQFETIIQAHDTPLRAMTYTHAGNFLISGDDAGNVRYWRTNLELVKNYSAHKEAIRQLTFAPGDMKFASASDDSTIRVWDFARVTEEQVLAGHGGDVKCVDWHPSKSLLVSGSKDGLIKLWCPRSGKSLATMHGHKGTVTSAEWSSNGNWVLTGSRDQTCRVYDIRMQAELATFIGHGKDITVSSWHSIHEELFVSGGHDGSLCFWLVGRQGVQAEVPIAHEGSVWSTAWHPLGHLLVTGASDAATKFWCRGRPGDPFMEQQEAEQAALAAMAGEEAATTAPIRAPPPALFSGTGIAGGSSGSQGMAAIPGIGEAMAKQVVVAPIDIYAASNLNYDGSDSGQLPPPAAAAAPARGSGGGGDREPTRRQPRGEYRDQQQYQQTGDWRQGGGTRGRDTSREERSNYRRGGGGIDDGYRQRERSPPPFQGRGGRRGGGRGGRGRGRHDSYDSWRGGPSPAEARGSFAAAPGQGAEGGAGRAPHQYQQQGGGGYYQDKQSPPPAYYGQQPQQAAPYGGPQGYQQQQQGYPPPRQGQGPPPHGQQPPQQQYPPNYYNQR